LNRKSQNAAFIVFFITSILIITPFVSAVTRRTHLINYILANQDQNNRFGTSYEETSYALEILNDCSMLGSVNTESLQSYLQNEIQEKFETSTMDVYNLYYLLKSLDFLISTGDLVNNSLKSIILDYLDGTNQTTGGFSPTNSSNTSGLVSTYFAIKAYNLIDSNQNISNIHKNWTLNCRNSGDGGYGGNASLPSSLISTYYAILILNNLDAINEITNVTDTVSYLTSFYIDQVNDQTNYGGYLIDNDAKFAILSSTYYCIKSLNILSPSELHKGATCSWVYSRQNIKDGGFVDKNDEIDQVYSSIPSSYFAFKTITLLGGNLDVQIWMVEFNWILLVVILLCIGVFIAIAIFFWRRNRL